MATALMELKSEDGRLLLSGRVRCGNVQVWVHLSGFTGSDATVAEDVKVAVDFARSQWNMGETLLVLPLEGNETDDYSKVGLEFVNVYMARRFDHSAKPLHLKICPARQNHLDFLSLEECHDHVRGLLLFGENQMPDQTSSFDLRKLWRLKGIRICCQNSKPRLLSWLAESKLPKSTKRLKIQDGGDTDTAQGILAVLRKHPRRFERLSVMDMSTVDATATVLLAIGEDGSNLQNLTIEHSQQVLWPQDDTDLLLAALKYFIKALSPKLRTLKLKIRLPSAEIEEMKEALAAAMDHNKEIIALEEFMFDCNDNEELREVCSGFAAQKKILRAAASTNRIAPSLLPQAMRGIQRHPSLSSPERFSATMLFSYLQSNAGIVPTDYTEPSDGS